MQVVAVNDGKTRARARNPDDATGSLPHYAVGVLTFLGSEVNYLKSNDDDDVSAGDTIVDVWELAQSHARNASNATV